MLASSCWLQMDQSIIFGQYIPIVIFCIAIIMLFEAGTNVDPETMVKLIGKQSIIYYSVLSLRCALMPRGFLRLVQCVIRYSWCLARCPSVPDFPLHGLVHDLPL